MQVESPSPLKVDPELREQIFGYWVGPDDELPDRPIGPPTGAVLPLPGSSAAVATAAKGAVGIVSFAEFLIMNFKEDTWAQGLRTQPGLLAHRAVSLFALRMVDSIGWWRAGHWGVRFPGSGSPAPRARAADGIRC